MKYLKRYFRVSRVLILIIVLSSCADDVIFTISPLTRAVMVNEPVTYKIAEDIGDGSSLIWDFGDGTEAYGSMVAHEYHVPGVYTVTLYATKNHDQVKQSTIIIRVHTPETVHVPQVFLDTDARNEADDQHYIAYCGSSLILR